MKTPEQQMNVIISNMQNLLWEHPDPNTQEIILECLYRIVHEPELIDSKYTVKIYEWFKSYNHMAQEWIDTIKVTEGW